MSMREKVQKKHIQWFEKSSQSPEPKDITQFCIGIYI